VKKFLDSIEVIFQRWKLRLGMAAAFFLPIKLFIAHLFIVPLLLLWLPNSRQKIRDNLNSPALKLATPLWLFILTAMLSSFFGLDALHSLQRLSTLAIVVSLILVFAEVCSAGKFKKILAALLCGQLIGALYAILRGAFPKIFPALLLGRVTQSGQLALGISLCLGAIIFLSQSLKSEKISSKSSFALGDLGSSFALGCLNFLFATTCAFGRYFGLAGPPLLVICLTLGLSLGFSLHTLRKSISSDTAKALLIFLTVQVLPIMTAAILANLKRGPWSGVMLAAFILILIYGRRHLVPIFLAAALLFLSIEPIKERLSESSQHFFISGGRSQIWQIGAELAMRYPLGIGFKNGRFLSNFSDEIPRELTHFHNNFLNIIVEDGWIAFALFVWWVLSTIKYGFQKPYLTKESILRSSIAAALIAWQVAGLVEYNFGDSEVLLVVFVLIGMLAALSEELQEAKLSSA